MGVKEDLRDGLKVAFSIHEEATKLERQQIVRWLRTTPRAGGVLLPIEASNTIARLADAIDRGEHAEPGAAAPRGG